jgi:hypothetical protein
MVGKAAYAESDFVLESIFPTCEQWDEVTEGK